MDVQANELITLLGRFNPWWHGESIPDLPHWRRSVYDELFAWISKPLVSRAIMLAGARQVGKTTLMLQVIEGLLEQGIEAANILYITLDHPILKQYGLDAVLEAWREREPRKPGNEYIFIDEAQFIPDIGTWVKHQVDFHKDRQLVFTGSAMPLLREPQESGVGRWHTLQITTLSFYEYLSLMNIPIEPLPAVRSLQDLCFMEAPDIRRASELGRGYLGHFNDFLMRGGFPQLARIESVTLAQRLLREDIFDRALKRDMTALFGVRRVLDLERLFLYLCMHDGGLLDVTGVCNSLQLTRPSVQNFLELLEASHLVYRLLPYGYGKEVLRAQYKVYLADSAIASAVLVKGKTVLDDPLALSVAAESAVLKHLYGLFYHQGIRLTYWKGKKDREVDFLTDLGGALIPFEVKYQAQAVMPRDLKGLVELCADKSLSYGFVVTKSLDDFGPLTMGNAIKTHIMRVPASLLCYWISRLG